MTKYKYGELQVDKNGSLLIIGELYENYKIISSGSNRPIDWRGHFPQEVECEYCGRKDEVKYLDIYNKVCDGCGAPFDNEFFRSIREDKRLVHPKKEAV